MRCYQICVELFEHVYLSSFKKIALVEAKKKILLKVLVEFKSPFS